MGIPSCFVLPCFGAGCHTFGLKIATAAMRPRNDTKTGRFCLENRRFLFYAVVFARCRSASAFKRFVPEIVPFSIVLFRKLFRFPAKPIKFVIARRAHFLRPTRQSLTKRFLYCFCRIWALVSLFSPASRLFFQKNDVS